ncbi:unnamed protein product [Ectocarpus sp. 13 AM-2016]
MAQQGHGVQEEAPGWRQWEWGNDFPHPGTTLDLPDAADLIAKFPEPATCMPFLGGMWLSYSGDREVLITVPHRSGNVATPITILVGMMDEGMIERVDGRRPYMCSGGTKYTTFCEDGVYGVPDREIIGQTTRVWGADLLDLPGPVRVVVQHGAGPPGGALRKNKTKVWFAATSPYVGGTTYPASWDEISFHQAPVSAAQRALRIARTVIVDNENLPQRAGYVDTLRSDFRKGERPGICRHASLRGQEMGREYDVFLGSAETAPLAWLRNSKSGMDRVVGSVLRGFEGPSKVFWVFCCAPYIVWRGLGSSSFDHSVAGLIFGIAMLFLVASFGFFNRSVSRAISPFKGRFDPIIAVFTVVATASSGASFVLSVLGDQPSVVEFILDAIVSLYVCSLYSLGNNRGSRPANPEEWCNTCLGHGVEFAEVGIPLKVSRRVPDEMERDYAGTLGGSPWTAAVHDRRPCWQDVPHLTADGWELHGAGMDNDEVFAESGGRDRRKDAWLAAFISASLMDPHGSISDPGARRRLSAVLVLLAQNAEQPPGWASACVTLEDLSEGRSDMADMHPWYDDIKKRAVVLAHRGVGLALEVADDAIAPHMKFPILARPKEIIKWAVIGCDPHLLLRQPFRQSTCREATTVGFFSLLRAIKAPRANNSLSSEILICLAGCAFAVGLKHFEHFEWTDLATAISVLGLIVLSAAELLGNFVAALAVLLCSRRGVVALMLLFGPPVVGWSRGLLDSVPLSLPFLCAVAGYYMPATVVALAQAIHGSVWYPGVAGRVGGGGAFGAGSGCGAPFQERLLLKVGCTAPWRVVEQNYTAHSIYFDGRSRRAHREYQVVALT